MDNGYALSPMFERVSTPGKLPEVLLITRMGREVATRLGLATPVELVGVLWLAVDMMAASPEDYVGKTWGAPIGDLIAMVRHGDLRYEPRENAFVLEGTGKRFPVPEIPPGQLELENAFHPEEDPGPSLDEARALAERWPA